MRLRNTNPLGTVDLPLIGRTLEPGEEFDVPDEQGAALLEQVGNYEAASPADLESLTVEQLKEQAVARDIDTTGLTKKSDLITAIRKG